MFRRQMKRSLFLIIAVALSPCQTASAQTVYLIIKSDGGNALSLLSVPMSSMDACEEAGAKIISSKRLDKNKYAAHDGFECVKNN